MFLYENISPISEFVRKILKYRPKWNDKFPACLLCRESDCSVYSALIIQRDKSNELINDIDLQTSLFFVWKEL